MVDEKSAKAAELLNEKYESIKATMSKARKEGVDLQFEQLMLIPIPAKIAIVAELGERRDYDRANQALSDVKEVVNSRIETFKNENHQKITQKGAIADFSAKEKRLRTALKQGKSAEARQIYQELKAEFQEMDRTSRSRIYPDLMELVSLLRLDAKKG